MTLVANCTLVALLKPKANHCLNNNNILVKKKLLYRPFYKNKT